MSSRKYFNFRPYFMGILCKSCGKGCGKNVDENVQNPASVFTTKIRGADGFLQRSIVFVNSGSLRSKKKFCGQKKHAAGGVCFKFSEFCRKD